MFTSSIYRALGFALALCTAALAFAADPPLNPDTLKPGDKLEFRKSPNDEWQTVEFVSKGPTANVLMVNRPPIARPVQTSISLLRLPQAPPPAAKGETGQLVEDLTAKSRTWSDRTGGFKIEAALVRVEDGKAVLKRADNNLEISVPLEKLCDADRKLIASTQPAAAESETLSMRAPRTADAVTTPKSKDDADAKSAGDVIPLTPTNYKTAKQLELPSSAPWTYERDLAPKITLGKAYSIRLKPGTNFFDSPERVLPLPKDRKAFVVFLDHTPGNDKYVARVQACGLDSGTVDGAAVFGVGFEPLELSDDGSLVLGRSSGFFNQTHKELRIYQRIGHTVKQLCAWQPYATPKEGSENKSDASRDWGVSWATLIDNQHVLTQSDELVLWELPSLKPVYRLKVDWLTTPVLSANKKYLFTVHGKDLIVLKTADGQLAGRIKYSADDEESESFGNSTLALSLDGKRMAAARWGQIRVWDLQSQKLVRDFTISDMQSRNQVDWISDNHLLFGGQTVVDVERRIPISRSTLPLEAYEVQAGKTWYVERGRGRDAATLKVATMPDEAMLAAAAKLNPDDLLVLHPGMSVALEMQAGGTPEEIDQVKRALVERLIANGMSVAPDSTTHLIALIGPGKTATMRYQNRYGKVEERQVPTKKLSLAFEANNETLWKHEQQSFAPSVVFVKENETIDEVIARDMESRNKALSIQAFAGIRLPQYVSRIPKPEKPK